VQLVDTPLAGAFVVEPSPIKDERGFFARTFCAEVFAARGLDDRFVQSSVSFNRRAGTLRGLHYQASPFGEAKLVRCTMGVAWDVMVDVRTGSPTYGRWFAIELSAMNRRAVYIPRGFAHGFITRSDDVEIEYQISTPYAPEHTRGIRYDDPVLAIEWPQAPAVISARDLALEPFQPEAGL